MSGNYQWGVKTCRQRTCRRTQSLKLTQALPEREEGEVHLAQLNATLARAEFTGEEEHKRSREMTRKVWSNNIDEQKCAHWVNRCCAKNRSADAGVHNLNLSTF